METTTRTGADLSMSRNAISRSSIDNLESSESAVSWSAIVAGGVAAAALSLILLILGTGLGFSSVSPWAREGISASTLGITAIVWVTVTQILASGMGGYIAGRMRTQWTGVHTDEVYFRDTAHGFLAWAVASLATAALLTSVIGSILGAGTQAAATIAGGAVSVAAGAAKSRSKSVWRQSRESGRGQVCQAETRNGSARAWSANLQRFQRECSVKTDAADGVRWLDMALAFVTKPFWL